MHGRLLELAPGSVTVGFTRAAGFHRTAVSNATGREVIERALTEHFGQPTRLIVDESTERADAAGPSLAESSAQAREAHQRSTGDMVRNHPAVRAALSLLGGEVEHIQVLQPEQPPAVREAAPSDEDAG